MRSGFCRLLLMMFTSSLACSALATAAELPPELLRTAAALRDRAQTEHQAYQIVRSLTTEVGHRFAGSSGDARAVAWALRTFEKLGFDRVVAEPVTVPRWERGTASCAITAPWPQQLAVTALGRSVGTPEPGIEAEVVEVASLEALAELTADQVAGRIVFFNTPTERARDGSGYGRSVKVRGKGASYAAQKGAVAVVIRSIGTDNNRLPHTGGLRYAEDMPRIPAAALSIPDADLLAAQLESGETVRLRLRLTARTLPDATSANVIGEIRGREAPEEIVLLAAHLDSWDVGTGALDDGVGCAIVMETARLVGLQSEQRPRRSLRVVLYANEELGISGGKAYAKAHLSELPLHVAAVEADFGAGRVWRFDSKVDSEQLPRVAGLLRLLEPLGIEPGDNKAGGGVDLIPLRKHPVPLFDLQQDGSDYFDYHHTENDTLDKIDREALAQVMGAWSALVYALAEMPDRFTLSAAADEPDGP